MVNVKVIPTSVNNNNDVMYTISVSGLGDVTAEDIARAVQHALSSPNAESDVKSEPTETRDFSFVEVEPLLLDVVALLKVMSKLDTAVESGEGAKLNFQQTRLLYRAIMDANEPNDLEANLQTMYQSLTGKYYDHEKYNFNI